MRRLALSHNSQAPHWPEYGAELAGTAILVFVGLSAVTLNFSRGSPTVVLIPNASLRLLITGLIFSGSGALVAISPLGKLSGGHVNPAVSLAFYLHGKLLARDLVGYIIGQFLGGILGAFLLVAIWGQRAASVRDGMTLPNPAYPLWIPFLAEAGMTALLVLSIFVFLSRQELMHWTPLMVWLLIAVLVWREAPLSGTSLNPARSFGPALVSWHWAHQWLYFVAPTLGGMLAVGIYRLARQEGKDVLTGKLFHAPDYRSIFVRVRAPHRPAEGPMRGSASPTDREAALKAAGIRVVRRVGS